MTAFILVIEDDVNLTEIVDAKLRREGYQVKNAENSEQAFEIINGRVPDLILLDIMLPDESGFDICRRLRARASTATVPIIMTTALSDIQNKSEGFQAGADDYVTKPYDFAELLLRMDVHLRKSQAVMQQGSSSIEPGKIIAVFSLKGGAGVTSLAVNTAVGLSMLWGESAALADFVAPIGSCDVFLNVSKQMNLGDIVKVKSEQIDGEYIEQFLYKHETGVHLLPGVSSPENADLITSGHINKLLNFLQSDYPYVVLDTPHDFSENTLAILDLADEILLPMTPELSSVRLTVQALRTFETLGYPPQKTSVIINWTYSDANIENKLGLRQIEKTLNQPVNVVISHDRIWSDSINVGHPVVTQDESLPIVILLENLAWQVSRASDHKKRPAEPTKMWMRTVQRLKRGSRNPGFSTEVWHRMTQNLFSLLS